MAILQPIEEVLLAVLQFFRNLTGDYGLAIIMLTITVRVIMLPLTIKQTKSMQEMKKLQPKLKQLQEKHKNDKQKLQEEIMKFYGDNKVNPMSGCLPLVLQLPIMIALFQVLNKTGASGHNFLFIIKDLGLSAAVAVGGPTKIYPDLPLSTAALAPYIVLIALMVITTYIPSKMMSADPQQDRMMLFISAFMIYFGWTLPAGVLVYLVVSQTWTIGQQYITMRSAEAAA